MSYQAKSIPDREEPESSSQGESTVSEVHSLQRESSYLSNTKAANMVGQGHVSSCRPC